MQSEVIKETKRYELSKDAGKFILFDRLHSEVKGVWKTEATALQHFNRLARRAGA